MFERITPEQAGIDSARVAEYLELLKRRSIPVHSILMMKGNQVFAEYYWEPFHADFCHRMYSQTKSYVAIAIGILEQEGKLKLCDRIADYFPEKIDSPLPPYLAELTIEQMLTMSTAGEPQSWWFVAGDPDRSHLYFNRPEGEKLHPAGTIWRYDSAGSQQMSALIEKLTGMTTFDFLYDRIFRHLGTFKTATMLKTPNGDSWGDSALICTPRDMASFARLLMQGGAWEGKQLINADYVRRATSKLVDNRESAHDNFFYQGYGYQIWHIEGDGFAFNGMGSQYTLCYPAQDLLLVCTADCQGNSNATPYLAASFYDHIVLGSKDAPIAANSDSVSRLAKATKNLKLFCVEGAQDSPFRSELDGAEYVCEDNRMGITRFSFHFAADGKTGELHYTNAQGDKVLPFGVNHNVFGKFPQYGYSNDRGGVATDDGFLYNDAVSFAWLEEKKLIINVQIIDRYFGNGSMIFAFRGNDATVSMHRTAENFLTEYEGDAVAHRA